MYSAVLFNLCKIIPNVINLVIRRPFQRNKELVSQLEDTNTTENVFQS